MIQPTDRQMHYGRVAGAPHGGAARAALWLLACGLFALGGVAQGQPTDLTLTNATITSGSTSYAATNSITAGPAFTVSGSASVSFTAGSYIVLNPGFQATAGSEPVTFQAGIGTVVGPPDFTVILAPSSQTVTAGGSTTYAVTVTALNGFSGPVSFAGTVSPFLGASFSFSPATVTGSGTAQVTVVTPTSGTGSYTLALLATSGTLPQHTSNSVGLTVNAPPVGDFTLLISPSNQTIPVYAQGVPYTVTVTPASPSGYSGDVYIGLTGVSSACIDIPYFPTGTIAPGVPATFSVTIGCGANTTVSFTVVGNLGNVIRHSVTATINIGPTQNITVTSSAATPPSASAPGSVSYALQVTPVNGYTGTIQLSVSGLPTGTSGPSIGTFSPASLTFNGSNTPQTATLTVATAAGSPPGTYSMVVAGSGGGASSYTLVPLVISGTQQPMNLDQMAVLSMLVLRHEALAGPNAPTDNGGLYGLPPGDAATVNAAVDAASQQLDQLAAQAPSFTDGTANMNTQNAILQNLNQQMHTQISASSAQAMDAYMNGFISPRLVRVVMNADGTPDPATTCPGDYQHNCFTYWNEIDFYNGGGTNYGLGRLVQMQAYGPFSNSVCVNLLDSTEIVGGKKEYQDKVGVCACGGYGAQFARTEFGPIRAKYEQDAFHSITQSSCSGSTLYPPFTNVVQPTPNPPANWYFTESNGFDHYDVPVDLQLTVAGVFGADGTMPQVISTGGTATVTSCSGPMTISPVLTPPLPVGNTSPPITWSGASPVKGTTTASIPCSAGIAKVTASLGNGQSLSTTVYVSVVPTVMLSSPGILGNSMFVDNSGQSTVVAATNTQATLAATVVPGSSHPMAYHWYLVASSGDTTGIVPECGGQNPCQVMSCESMSQCVLTTGATGGAATVQVSVVDWSGDEVAASARLLVVQGVSIPTGPVVWWTGGNPNDCYYPRDPNTGQLVPGGEVLACYYKTTSLSVTALPADTVPADSSPVTWTVTDPTSGGAPTWVQWQCHAPSCLQLDVTATTHPPDGSLVSVVANYHGILSPSVFLVVDYAAEAVLNPDQTRDSARGQWGFMSLVEYILKSASESPMSYVDVHEEFAAQWSACVYSVTGTSTVGWEGSISQARTDPNDAGSGWGFWQTNLDGSFTDHISIAWAPGSPLMSPTPAPPPADPTQPLSTQANSWVPIVFWTGSMDTQNLGKYVPTAPMKQVRYTDHGRDELGNWSCPAQ